MQSIPSPGGKSAKDATGTSHEQQFIRSVIELHDKYLTYVIG